MSDILWRPYRESDIYYRDMDAVVRLHAETEEKFGQRFDLPAMSKPPVLKTWLAERAGEIVGGLYFEAVAEMCFIGTDPQVTASAKALGDSLADYLAARSFRVAKCFVPTALPGRGIIGEALERSKFRNKSLVYDHYERLLRPSTAGRNGRS